jgi:hypothetical protein
MSARTIRRAAERHALKQARKAGVPVTVAVEPLQSTIEHESSSAIPEPGLPFPSLDEISSAKLAANRANAQFSTGAKSPETRATCAQNHTIHGLARHENGNFKILTSEDANAFEAFKQSLIEEHAPATPTQSILVANMAQSHWLAQRAQRLQDFCIDPDTGAVVDDKKFSLYVRYETTHTRAFHKCLQDLLKLRAETRKAERGFEAQRVETERHEMKKQSHYWDVLKKDAQACHQISLNALQNMKARAENPGFEAEYAAELAKRGLENNSWEVASKAS